MRRVAVVGPGGAGKSTFTKQLGECLGLPVVHLDAHFWQPNWVETPRDEWRAWQERRFAADAWIADGNYGGTFDARFARADTVIVVCPPRTVCLWGALRRSVCNLGSDIQAVGCPERIDLGFYRWIWRYPNDARRRLDAALSRHPHLTVIELTSRGAMRDFLRQ